MQHVSEALGPQKLSMTKRTRESYFLLIFLFSFLHLCCAQEDSLGQDEKVELAKYYVAYFILESKINYYNRIIAPQNLDTPGFLDSTMELDLISDNYFVTKFPTKFLGFDIFCI